jgi:hypothetical protein
MGHYSSSSVSKQTLPASQKGELHKPVLEERSASSSFHLIYFTEKLEITLDVTNICTFPQFPIEPKVTTIHNIIFQHPVALMYLL